MPSPIVNLLNINVLCFRKNETVNGIIGKIQGVNKAIIPPMKTNKKKFNNEFSLFFCSL